MTNHKCSTESIDNETIRFDRPISCRILTDGKAGDLVQCLGVAERLGLAADVRTVAPRPPWVWLMPWGPPDPRDAGAAAPPWPDLAIASGRRAVASLRNLRRASGGRTFTVFLKDPRIGSEAADFIWVPAHDGLRGPNVLASPTSPHRVNPQVLADLRAAPPPDVAALPGPRVTVLLGGPTAGVSYGPDDVARFSALLRRLAAAHEASFLITPSRRTPPALLDAAADAVKDRPHILWRGNGDNPYFAFLAVADAIVVTGDSANMASEAAATGRAIMIFRPSGLSRKLVVFLDGLEAEGIARPFRGELETSTVRPVDSTQLIAAEIVRRMRSRQPPSAA